MIKRLFDSNALWLSMVIGALGYQWFRVLSPLLPWLIFFMLFFTFCKINPLDLRLHRWHWVVLVLQIALSLGAYAGVYLLTGNRFLAQGLMLCFIMPTATAAPIIAGKLGGSIQNLTTFTLLSNFATAIIVPIVFPLVNPMAEKAFLPALTLIISHISPLLLGPFFAAWAIRAGFNAYYRKKSKITTALPIDRNHKSQITNAKTFELPQKLAVIPFYLWVASIVILTAVVTETVIANYESQLANMLILLASSFFACLIQFFLGKWVGYKLPAPSKGKDYQDVLINPAAAPKTMAGVSSITAGQAFGQKNTSLGVWMAQTYLNPMSSIGAAAYIIWQNIFNSLQLALAARKK